MWLELPDLFFHWCALLSSLGRPKSMFMGPAQPILPVVALWGVQFTRNVRGALGLLMVLSPSGLPRAVSTTCSVTGAFTGSLYEAFVRPMQPGVDNAMLVLSQLADCTAAHLAKPTTASCEAIREKVCIGGTVCGVSGVVRDRSTAKRLRPPRCRCAPTIMQGMICGGR